MSAVHKSAIIAQKNKQPDIKELCVFGERNSGTNYVEKLLRQNFSTFDVAQSSDRYGWKHGFPNMVSAPKVTLAVVSIRNPQTWVQSMWKRPWHAAPQLRELEFSDFIRAQWVSVVDELRFGLDDPDDPRVGQELMWDRDPRTGLRFENILKMRTAKMHAHLQLREQFHNTLVLRQEDFIADPEGLLDFVAETYNLKRNETYSPVTGFRGNPDKPYVRPTYAALSDEDLMFVRDEIDMELEQKLGFDL